MKEEEERSQEMNSRLDFRLTVCKSFAQNKLFHRTTTMIFFHLLLVVDLKKNEQSSCHEICPEIEFNNQLFPLTLSGIGIRSSGRISMAWFTKAVSKKGTLNSTPQLIVDLLARRQSE